MSSITKRKITNKKTGKERICNTIRFKDQHGVWRERVAGPRKGDAVNLLRRTLEEVNNGTFGVEKPEDPTFSKFCERFLKAKKRELATSTYSDYEQIIENHLKPFFGKKHLSKITPSLIHSLIEHLEGKRRKAKGKARGDQGKPLAPATIGKIYRYLKTILRYALTLQLIEKDPTIGIKAPRIEKKEMDYLTKDEVGALLDAAEGDIKDLLSLAIFSGLRQGEILALRWKDIDFNTVIIKVVRSYKPSHGFGEPKTPASRRSVRMTTKLSEIMKIRLERSKSFPEDLVFPNHDGNPQDRANLVTRGFEPALEKAGLRRIRFHDLRHTYASLCISVGMDPKALQGAMGHSSITVTMDTYAHLFPGSYDTALAKLDRMFSKDSKVVQLRPGNAEIA
jgi:integrase